MPEDQADWKSQIAKNSPIVLIILGLALIVTSAGGGIAMLSFVIPPGVPKVTVACTGFAIVLFGGLLLWRGAPEESSVPFKKCEFRIVTPAIGTEVGENPVEFWGTYKKKGGKQILLIEKSLSSDNLYFKTKVEFRDQKRWTASCHVGGPVGSVRVIYVAVLGESGSALYDYYQRVKQQKNDEVAFRELTKDIYLSDDITLRKK
jgi:hypothetical protein